MDRTTQPNAKAIAIQQVRLFDGAGLVIDRATLVIRGSTIKTLGPSRTIAVPPDAIRINGHGLTVLPGLIDCHVHLCLGAEPDVVSTLESEQPAYTLLKAARHAQRTLEAGITTVRDVGSRDHTIFALKQAIETGLLPGPRIIGAGQALCMIGGHARFIGREVQGAEQVREAVAAQVAAGAQVIKVIATGGVLTPGTSPDQAQMTVEELQVAVEEAKRLGRKVAAHAHGGTGMTNAIRAGVRSIEHATLLDEATARLFERHAVYMVPTLSALATTAACRRGCGIPDSALDKARALTKRHQASFKLAHRRGLLIAMGTDAGTPFNYHGDNVQELERMVGLGMTPKEAIMASTSHAARLIGIENQVGTLARGMIADLLVVNGDPLTHIDHLRDRDRILGVMQAGRFVAGPLTQ
ncbi:MAG: amidohydrolase family protein [Nitrospira sp.]|nr:amidohydrolase family protein [Nitrospira sp.]MCP9464710.1 amidohydrolase family protein [Nitrospira sp.]